jgi:hypothetical protein
MIFRGNMAMNRATIKSMTSNMSFTRTVAMTGTMVLTMTVALTGLGPRTWLKLWPLPGLWLDQGHGIF